MTRQVTEQRPHGRRRLPPPAIVILLAAAFILTLFMLGPRTPLPSMLAETSNWWARQQTATLDVPPVNSLTDVAANAIEAPHSATRPAPRSASGLLLTDKQPGAADADPATPHWPPRGASRSRSAADADDPEPDRRLSIAGSVLDDRGVPLPGILIRVGDRGLSTTSDALGMFKIQQLAAGNYLLAVDENEHHHGARRVVPAGALAADLHLQRKGSVAVHGRILGMQGQGIADVAVRSLGQQAQTSSLADGQYRIQISIARAGAPPVLDFSHPDYRDARRRVNLNPADPFAPVQLDVRLQTEHEKVPVLGWVSNPLGQRIAGARVQLYSQAPPVYQATLSDTWGEFRFLSVEVGPDYHLRVTPPDESHQHYRSDAFAVGPDGAFHEAILEPSSTAELSGLLVDLEGRSLSDLSIWMHHEDVPGQGSIPIQTDRHGHFGPLQVAAGGVRFLTHANPQLSASGIVLAPAERRQIQIPLDWGADWLLGRVIDERGQPVARATVVAQWQHHFPELRSSSRRQTLTDLEGYFHFANLAAPAYQLTIQADGFLTGRHEVSMQPAHEVVLQLRKPNRP